jgi:hypothetical protein
VKIVRGFKVIGQHVEPEQDVMDDNERAENVLGASPPRAL